MLRAVDVTGGPLVVFADVEEMEISPPLTEFVHLHDRILLRQATTRIATAASLGHGTPTGTMGA